MNKGIMIAVVLTLALVVTLTGVGLAEEPEFKPLNQSASVEFKSLDEAGSLKPLTVAEVTSRPENPASSREPGLSAAILDLKFQLGALAFTILAGLFVRFKSARFSRPLFLLGSLAILGFWNGGCPCVIGSFQNLVLWALGVDIKIQSLIWFTGVVILTYFLGRVWCGWVCHLGALQEFLYKSNRFELLKGERAQQIMRWMRYFFTIALVVQLIITRTNLYSGIDPFKVAFNLNSHSTVGWLLLGLLLITSIFIYRPFCRSVCPVGLILGWVNKLPGSLTLRVNHSCSHCRTCAKRCEMKAITDQADIHGSDCIMCGNCLDACKKECVTYIRKGAAGIEKAEDNFYPEAKVIPLGQVDPESMDRASPARH